MERRGGESKGDTWWRNEEVTEAVSRKKEAQKVMCWNRTEENKRSRAKKAVSKGMREKAEEVDTELQNCPNGMYRLV